jgi:hypothetical protein
MSKLSQGVWERPYAVGPLIVPLDDALHNWTMHDYNPNSKLSPLPEVEHHYVYLSHTLTYKGNKSRFMQ